MKLDINKYVLVLRTCDKYGKSSNGFTYPKKGYVKAPDFKPTSECGNGLHGFLWGEGDGKLANWSKDALWQVLRVKRDKNLIQLYGKVKFKEGYVVFTGSRKEATDLIYKYGKYSVIGGSCTSGYKGQAKSGDYGQAKSGDYGQSTSGEEGQSTSGHKGQSTSGDKGQSTSEYKGQSTSGYKGQSTSGDKGQSISGYQGQSTSGYYGQSITFLEGRVKSGDGGVVGIRYWSENKQRYSMLCGDVGINKGELKPNTWYEVDVSTDRFKEIV